MSIKLLNCEIKELTENDKTNYAPKVEAIFKNGKIFNKIEFIFCHTRFIIHTDGQITPSRYASKGFCKCGKVLIEYNTTEEPFLMEI